MKCHLIFILLLQFLYTQDAEAHQLTELQREVAVLEVQTVGLPPVSAPFLQDAKAHQLKELRCEAAVLEVYTGLYKMTELMQDSRAEVYVGTIGEVVQGGPACLFLSGQRSVSASGHCEQSKQAASWTSFSWHAAAAQHLAWLPWWL